MSDDPGWTRLHILTETDFVEVDELLVPRKLDDKKLVIVLICKSLRGIQSIRDGSNVVSAARSFFNDITMVAAEFPEYAIGLLVDEEASNILPKLVSDWRLGSESYVQAVIFSSMGYVRDTDASCEETADSLRLWLRGISLAWGLRPASGHTDLIVRLAYQIAQPPNVGFPHARWDDTGFRWEMLQVAKKALSTLIEDWKYWLEPSYEEFLQLDEEPQ